MKQITISLVMLIAFATAAFAAQTAEEKGLAIAQEADQRDIGWKDSQAQMTMTLVNSEGQKIERQMRNRALEIKGDGDKSLVIFDRPRDVKGTSFLTFTHKKGPDDQWLYLPALRRVKRISSGNKSGPFLGSEFSYEDIGSQEVEQYTYKYLKDEKLGAVDCFVMERYPTDKHSGYTKQVLWIDKVEYRLQKSEYYDRKAALLKILTVSGYKKYLDKYWRGHRWEMKNQQNQKSTILEWKDYKFGTGLVAADFDKNALKRIK